MLDTLITSKTRIKLLLKFFLNGNTSSYLRNLESEFGESSNAIRIELNKFEEAGLLNTAIEGNKKLFKANTRHPLFKDIHSILLKYTGIDKIVEHVINKLGEVESVYLIGELAKGLDSPIIDLVIVGNINKTYLMGLAEKAEKIVNKKIRYIVYSSEEFKHSNFEYLLPELHLKIWEQ
jgi:hypothetical protein